ncbi:MAG: hypothetical protein SWY16_02340 [Cyanobacteriota bacterium]|nr:hypothetical protein [Cyanobacteriota bacterium]
MHLYSLFGLVSMVCGGDVLSRVRAIAIVFSPAPLVLSIASE